jgi:hypothetical protein
MFNKRRLGVDTEYSNELSLVLTDIPQTLPHSNRLQEMSNHESFRSDLSGTRGDKTCTTDSR